MSADMTPPTQDADGAWWWHEPYQGVNEVNDDGTEVRLYSTHGPFEIEAMALKDRELHLIELSAWAPPWYIDGGGP